MLEGLLKRTEREFELVDRIQEKRRDIGLRGKPSVETRFLFIVQKVSEIARGKAYFTSTVTLGQYIMMDFMKRKRRRIA